MFSQYIIAELTPSITILYPPLPSFLECFNMYHFSTFIHEYIIKYFHYIQPLLFFKKLKRLLERKRASIDVQSSHYFFILESYFYSELNKNGIVITILLPIFIVVRELCVLDKAVKCGRILNVMQCRKLTSVSL
jgi:hypothetical protein